MFGTAELLADDASGSDFSVFAPGTHVTSALDTSHCNRCRTRVEVES